MSKRGYFLNGKRRSVWLYRYGLIKDCLTSIKDSFRKDFMLWGFTGKEIPFGKPTTYNIGDALDIENDKSI